MPGHVLQFWAPLSATIVAVAALIHALKGATEDGEFFLRLFKKILGIQSNGEISIFYREPLNGNVPAQG